MGDPGAAGEVGGWDGGLVGCCKWGMREGEGVDEPVARVRKRKRVE